MKKINSALSKIVYEFRQSYLPNRAYSKKIVAWKEDHRLRTGAAKALVFILPTRGCSWALSKSGGCSICGYIYDNPQSPNFEQLCKDFSYRLSSLISEGEKYSIKLFTSGSFLDSNEIPDDVLVCLLEKIKEYNKQVEEVVLESRPAFVTDRKLELISQHFDIGKIEIAIGLESANNNILKNSINKGFFWEDFERAVKKVFNYNAKVKAYLLFKPPFVSEYDAIIDTFSSTKKVIDLGVDTVSINAINIQRGTFLSNLFEKGQYRPPYLWSLVHVSKELKKKYPHLRIICNPVAGGKTKGAHNCGKCDAEVVKALADFTLTQDLNVLTSLKECNCKNEWKSYLAYSKLSINDINYV